MSEQASAEVSRWRRKLVFIVIFLAIAALDGWVLAVWSSSWSTKTQLVLQILAVYTFAFGFIAETQIGERFGSLLEEVTSPNLFAFIAGNFTLLALPFHALSLGFNSRKTKASVLDLLDTPILIVFALLALAYAAFHIVVIIPLAYFSHLIAHIPIRSIKYAANDIEYAMGEQRFTVKELVRSNEIALKNFLVAIPGAVSSLVLGIVA